MQEQIPTSTQARHISRQAVQSLHFTAEEKRRVFRSMVVNELEAGFLRYSRRQALIGYAAKLDISEFDACLLIAEAQYHAGDLEPLHFASHKTLENITQPDTWSIPLRLSSAIIAAIFVDLLLIYWLFG